MTPSKLKTLKLACVNSGVPYEGVGKEIDIDGVNMIKGATTSQLVKVINERGEQLERQHSLMFKYKFYVTGCKKQELITINGNLSEVIESDTVNTSKLGVDTFNVVEFAETKDAGLNALRDKWLNKCNNVIFTIELTNTARQTPDNTVSDSLSMVKTLIKEESVIMERMRTDKKRLVDIRGQLSGLVK